MVDGNGHVMAQHPPSSSPDFPSELPRLEVDGEQVTIINFSASLPDSPSADDRVALARAGRRARLALDDDGLHAVARAIADPAAAARAVEHDLLATEVTGPARLMVVQQRAFLTELFPLIQPRAGAAPRTVDPPRVDGDVTGEGGDAVPQAMTVVRFRDEQHLVDHIAQTVRQTLQMGKDYATSILTKRVARPVLAHVVRVEFDEGEPIHIVVVRDGITRVVSSWRTLYPALSGDELAERIASELLASKRSRRANDTETARRARGRDEKQKRWRALFAEGMATGAPTEDALRIGQALILPVQMIVSFGVEGRPTVPVAQQFDDAVQSLVASVHGEFQPWESSASDAAAIQRALPRAVHDGDLGEDVAKLAAGELPVSAVPDVFDAKAPATALWRAVYLVAGLCNPSEFEAIKRHLRELLGLKQIARKTYVGHMMTLVDLPWRLAKQHTRLQARRAWNNGGPVPHHLLGTTWDPVPTDDFTSLVPAAVDGDDNARATLQVAGGIALVADKLLLSNTGSALAAGEVPFRANVNDVVTGLGDTEAGLWLLARAANAFQADQAAINSFTPQELLKNPGIGKYAVPVVDSENPRRCAVDNAGQSKRLTPYDVVAFSDPVRARESEEAKANAKKASTKTESSRQKAMRLRGELTAALAAARSALQLLVQTGDGDAGVRPVLGDRETWESLVDATQELNGTLYGLKPTPVIDSDDEDDEDGFDDAEEDAQ